MILVTGGTGFIGRHLVRYLLELGEDVRVMARNPSKLDADFSAGDVTDRESVRRALDGVEKVYHLAALFRHGVDPNEIWKVNYFGTKNVAEECLKRGIRLLHVSTVGVLGYANSEPLDENSPYNPNPNPYAESKAKAEEFVLEMRKKGLNAVVVRPAFVYGVGGSYGLNLLIDMIAKGRLKFVIGNGENYIHPIHVEDLVRALVLVMEKGEGIYIAANEKPIRLRYFIDLVAEFSGRKVRYGLPPKLAYLILKLKGGIGGSDAKETIMLFTKNWFYKVEKLGGLGWNQRVSMEEGIRETVEYLKRIAEGI